MNDEQYALLEEILSSPSPSGYEGAVRKIVKRELAKFCEEVSVDVMGNVIAKLKDNGGLKVLLDAHMDQVGLQVTHITKQGYLYFTNIGGVDAHMTAGQRVTIWSANGPVRGIIGRKPIHRLAADEKTKVTPLQKQFIDIGAKNREEAEKYVELGDPVTFSNPPERLGVSKDFITAVGTDDRVGVFAIIQAMRNLADRPHQATVYATISTQEELGLRGTAVAAYQVNPDVALAVDVSHAVDYPGMSAIENYADDHLGKGPIIFRGANMSPKIVELLRKVAKENEIPYQPGSTPLAPTNAQRIQLTRQGVATGALGIPNRYMHTPSEVVCLSDIENMSRLITEFVTALKPDTSFIPED
ncbi:MAG: M42 family metallopeptidase [Promethearchaeota archaeon]